MQRKIVAVTFGCLWIMVFVVAAWPATMLFGHLPWINTVGTSIGNVWSSTFGVAGFTISLAAFLVILGLALWLRDMLEQTQPAEQVQAKSELIPWSDTVGHLQDGLDTADRVDRFLRGRSRLPFTGE